MIALAYVALALLAILGIAALGRKRPLSEEEYEARKGKGGGIDNALLRSAGAGLLEAQGMLEPGRDRVKVVLEEKEERDAEGDPPEPGVS